MVSAGAENSERGMRVGGERKSGFLQESQDHEEIARVELNVND